MLSDKEKQEMLEDARSAVRREDFRRLRKATLVRPDSRVIPQAYLDFLSVMSDWAGSTVKRRPPVEYKNVRL